MSLVLSGLKEAGYCNISGVLARIAIPLKYELEELRIIAQLLKLGCS